MSTVELQQVIISGLHLQSQWTPWADAYDESEENKLSFEFEFRSHIYVSGHVSHVYMGPTHRYTRHLLTTREHRQHLREPVNSSHGQLVTP